MTTSTWDLGEFDQHTRSLETVLTDARSVKSQASAAGAGDLYMYGLLVGPYATPVMSVVVASVDNLLTALVDLNDDTRDKIIETRKLNFETEQTNVDNTADIESLIDQAPRAGEGQQS